MKFKIVFLLEYYLFLSSLLSIEYVTPKYYCSIIPPDSVICVNFVINNSNELFLLPYSPFATTHLYKFDINTCEFRNTVVYPDEVKYCYIPKNDTTAWKNIQSSKLICHPCTFSFKQLYPEFHKGNIYTWAYTLAKSEDNDSVFIPRRVIFRIDTNRITPIALERWEGVSLFPFGKSPLKGDTFVCFGIRRNNNAEDSHYVCLLDLKNKKFKEVLNLTEILKNSKIKFSEIGQTYFVFDSILVFYFYNQSTPIIINLSNKKYFKFNYKGQLESLKEANFHYSIDDNGDSVRTFMHTFLPNSQYLAVVGGKNKGQNFDTYALQNIYLQFYSPKDFSLQKEYEIKLLENKNYSFFDCFVSPINKSRIIFLVKESRHNNYDIYFLDL